MSSLPENRLFEAAKARKGENAKRTRQFTTETQRHRAFRRERERSLLRRASGRFPIVSRRPPCLCVSVVSPVGFRVFAPSRFRGLKQSEPALAHLAGAFGFGATT